MNPIFILPTQFSSCSVFTCKAKANFNSKKKKRKQSLRFVSVNCNFTFARNPFNYRQNWIRCTQTNGYFSFVSVSIRHHSAKSIEITPNSITFAYILHSQNAHNSWQMQFSIMDQFVVVRSANHYWIKWRIVYDILAFGFCTNDVVREKSKRDATRFLLLRHEIRHNLFIAFFLNSKQRILTSSQFLLAFFRAFIALHCRTQLMSTARPTVLCRNEEIFRCIKRIRIWMKLNSNRTAMNFLNVLWARRAHEPKEQSHQANLFEFKSVCWHTHTPLNCCAVTSEDTITQSS